MAPSVSDSTTRFSSRVVDYVKYRPSYPADVVGLLSDVFSLPQNATIVDIGSGTGILCKLLMDNLKDKNVKIIGVEPNNEMREAGDSLLASYKEEGRFESMSGTAEKMDLADHSVDLIVAAQAFHWFDVPKARAECQRILKPAKSGVALIWNERRGVVHEARDTPPPEWSFDNLDLPVMTAFDLMLVRRIEDYPAIAHHRSVDESSMKHFFGPKGFEMKSFPNLNILNYEQLEGRLRSSSYTPLQGQEGYEEMLQELKQIFEKYQKDGKINFMYSTNVFYGPISS